MKGLRWIRVWGQVCVPLRWQWWVCGRIRLREWCQGLVAIALLYTLGHYLIVEPTHAQQHSLASDRPVGGEAELSIDYGTSGSTTIDFDSWFDVPLSKPLLETLTSTIEGMGSSCRPLWDSPYSERYGLTHHVRCNTSEQSAGLVLRPTLDALPLMQLLRDLGSTNLNMTIELPELFPYQGVPEGFQPIADDIWLGNNSSRYSTTIDFSSIDSSTELSEPFEFPLLDVEYGYQWQDLRRMLAPLLAIALLAPFLTALGRRWALERMKPNCKTAAFHFQQYLSLSVLFIWGGWALSLLGMQWEGLFDFVSASWSAWGQSVAAFAGIIVVPAVICLTCQVIAFPVVARIGRVQPTMKKHMLTGLVEQGLVAQAFAVYVALPTFFEGQVRLAILWLVGSAASFFILKSLQAKLSGLIPQSVTVGPLRDRVFELALAAEVKIEQLYVLPTRKTQVANAFAVSGGMVMLTDYLLEHLTKREVDAVIAHELTHFERKHHASQGTLMIVVFGAIGVGASLMSSNYFLLFLLLSMLALAGGFAIQMHQSRRHEYEADWGAAKLTNDPEALISALAAITELAEMPAMWNPLAEALGTHPSLQNRAEAIAKAYRIPADRVEELLFTPDPVRESYAISAGDTEDSTVYSSEIKSSNALKVVLALSVTAAIASVVATVVVSTFFPTEYVLPIAIGSVAAFAALLVADNYLSQLGMKELGHRLHQKFKRQGLEVEGQSGTLVGFSPNLQPKLYEGTLFWDMGLLYLGADRLAYIGEQAQFSLPIDAVCYVGVTRLKFEWFRLILIQLQWRNQHGEIESGYLAIREGKTATELKLAAKDWFSRLQQWKAGQYNAPALPASTNSLPLPSIGTVTYAPLKTLKSGFNLLWITVLPTSLLLGIVFGLSSLNVLYACISASIAFFANQLPVLLFAGTEEAAVTPSHPPLSEIVLGGTDQEQSNSSLNLPGSTSTSERDFESI